MKFLALPLLLLTASPALAHHRHHHVINKYSYMRERDWSTCTKEEVHVTVYSDGSTMKEFKRHPWRRCINKHRHGYDHHHHHRSYARPPKVIQPNKQETSNNNVDDNSCIEGSVLGGIAGGGLGAALSRGDGRLWAIPLGIVGGAMAGCQVDGG